MSFFEIENVRAATSGRWLQRPASLKLRVLTGVGIDTRDDLTGKAFVAIRGQSHDGHAYLAEAAKAGARVLVVEHVPAGVTLPGDVAVVQVENTRRALARMALNYRRSLRGTKVIVVTGSAGKTTTKRLIDSVLAVSLQGSASPKSFNNDIGVPLTILAARPSDKYLIVEVGTNAPGEIAQLASVVEPDVAVITSIGRAHLEGLGSIEAVAKEKASLLRFLTEGGTAVVTADAPLLRPYLKSVPSSILVGEADDADLRLTARGADELPGESDWWFEINARQRFPLALPGKHNALNAIAALAVGRRLGLDDEAICAGLAMVEPAPMRMAMQQLGEITICNDAYNANPDSMRAALETFAELAAHKPFKRRIVVLGDMLELGPAGAELHREVGGRLLAIDAQAKIDMAIFVGELSGIAAAEVAQQWGDDRVWRVPAMEPDVAHDIAAMLQPGDAVLIKASRGMQLERLVPAIEAALHAQRHHQPDSHTAAADIEVPIVRRAVANG